MLHYIWLIPAPVIASLTGVTIAWWYILHCSRNISFVKSLVQAWASINQSIGRKILKDQRNQGYVVWFVWLPLGLYSMIAILIYSAINDKLSLALVLTYHIVRLGPYFWFMANVHSLVHNEAHGRGASGWWKGGTGSAFFTKHMFEWFIAPWYGIMPGNYMVAHNKIHHVYAGTSMDLSSSSSSRRNSVSSFLRYLFKFFFYWTSISPIVFMSIKGRHKDVCTLLGGMGYYFLLSTFLYSINPILFIVLLAYPLVEATILLGAIQWTWHCFYRDGVSIYQESVTILDSNYQVFNQDYHVEHHRNSVKHFSEYPAMYEKFKEEYVDQNALVFKNTMAFEMFFLIILDKMDVLAEKLVDFSEKMTNQEKEDLLRSYLCNTTTIQKEIEDNQTRDNISRKNSKSASQENSSLSWIERLLFL